MISYVYDPDEWPDWGGTYFPVITCDACAKPITKSGNVYWLVQDDGSIDPRLWFTHKAPCATLDRVIQRENGGFVYFEELDCWIKHLGKNFNRLPRVAARSAT